MDIKSNRVWLLGLILMISAGLSNSAQGADSFKTMLITDFTQDSADLGWYVVNDNVMGGRSEGDFNESDAQLFFSGRTNTNGGGFSSIRSRRMQLDLSEFKGIQLRVKGDGRRYTWRLTSGARYRGMTIGYWADFETRRDTWTTANIPFSQFVPRIRGYRLDGPPLDSSQISGMGIMIYDNKDGLFTLEIDGVYAYSAEAPFRLSQYQWDARALVISAPSEENDELQAQHAAVKKTLEAFADRDMVLVTLVNDATSKAGNESLTSEDVATARADLDIPSDSFTLKLIGKDGGTKLSATAAMSMDKIYALIDTMPMRQAEKNGQ